MNKTRILQLLPFVLIGLILCYTWYVIATTEHFATIKHQVALGLFLITLAVYFIKFSYGVVLTGLILILAIFNVIALFPNLVTSSYFITIKGKEITTPAIQWKSLLIFILFLALDFTCLIELFKSKNDSIKATH